MSTSDQQPVTATKSPARQSIFFRLYTGTGAFDIVGKRRRFYVIFGALVLVCLVSIVVRGFTFSIEFKGGTQIQMPANGGTGIVSTQAVTQTFNTTLGHPPASVVAVGQGTSASIQIQSETLNQDQVSKLETALFNQYQPLDSRGQPSQSAISDSAVSGSWGAQISQQALIGLIVFLVLVSVFLSIYFERWMALAALIALGNDLLVTAGVYSIVGFEVSPATVIGLLTILGFSLYDAVVVFDKVKENTRGILGLTRRTFAEEANLALNQTLMRSINTSLIALLPVVGLLIVGVGILGVGTLTDLALVQMVGIAGAPGQEPACAPGRAGRREGGRWPRDSGVGRGDRRRDPPGEGLRGRVQRAGQDPQDQSAPQAGRQAGSTVWQTEALRRERTVQRGADAGRRRVVAGPGGPGLPGTRGAVPRSRPGVRRRPGVPGAGGRARRRCR